MHTLHFRSESMERLSQKHLKYKLFFFPAPIHFAAGLPKTDLHDLLCTSLLSVMDMH